MATKRYVIKLKHPKQELLDQRAEIARKREKLSKILIWILIILAISTIFEFAIVFIRG